MNIRDEIWILADDRVGTYSQAVGLAQEIGFEYKIINLNYSFLANFPNFLFSESLLRIIKSDRKKIKELGYFPTIIISSGRRSAPIALHLKKLSQNKTKLIQIMNPELNFSKFDFVIIPEHDSIKSNANNLLITTGAMTKINNEIINLEKQKFSSWFLELKKPIIALLVGGSSNRTIFSEDSATNLAKQVSQITTKMSATLIVLNSRRTDEKINKAVKSNLDCNYKFFDWHEVKEENPYLAIIGYADFFIITGDSVSMISECCGTGKPVYIFDEKNISSSKHRKFHQAIFEKNHAKKLGKNDESLENFSPTKLQEAKRISLLVRKQILVDK